MFCAKCGKEVEKGNQFCPSCGCKVVTADEKNDLSALEVENTVPQTEASIEEQQTVIQNNKHSKKALLWSVVGVLSLLIMKLPYASVYLYFSGASDSAYTGYGVIACVNGTLGLAARMMILLIFVNIAIIFTGIAKYRDVTNKSRINRAIFIESILSAVASVSAFANIYSELSKFYTGLSASSVGTGVYLNLILSLLTIVLACWITGIHRKKQN